MGKTAVTLIVTAVVSLVVTIGGFWLYRTYTLTQPYDEVWIKINSRMPGALRAWSCKTVKANIPKPGIAPYGCQDAW